MSVGIDHEGRGLPEKCNERFMAVEKNQIEIRTTLHRISTNELVHIHADIKDIKGWIRAAAMAMLAGVMTLLVKYLFFT